MTDKPKFVAAPLTSLPSREGPKKEYDEETAKAILGLISTTVKVNNEDVPQTASDGILYAEAKLARAEANKAARLVAHVLPDGKITKSRVYGTGKNQFAWAIWMADAPAETAPETADAAPASGA